VCVICDPMTTSDQVGGDGRKHRTGTGEENQVTFR